MPRTKFWTRKKIVLLVILLAATAAAVWFFVWRRNSTPPSSLITVSRGSIAQEVTVTGRTKPVQDVSLAFERSGRIVSVAADVGKMVSAGDVLARLDDSELRSTLAGQVAAVAVQVAKLNDLKAGARPEDIDVSRADLAKAKQDLANLASTVSDTVSDAYTKSDDAVRKQTDTLFINDDSPKPELSFSVTDPGIKSATETGRLSVGTELSLWKNEISAFQTPLSQEVAGNAITAARSRLEDIRSFLSNAMDAVSRSLSLSQSTIDTYRANLGTARAEVNAALTAVNAQDQAMASQKITVQRLTDALALKVAGATPEAIAAADAAVSQAKAAVEGTKIQLEKTSLVSPITGIVTKQDAKKGEIAAANAPLVSIISESGMEIEANVPEVDIGKIALQNPVAITIDALPGETFAGHVFYVDPAETIIDGVVNFKIKVSFDASDSRIKSGMSAPLTIRTLEKTGVLIVPQYAILEKDTGVFVRVSTSARDDKSYEERPVKIGIRGAKGDVEIVSGVSEGDKVLNIGIRNSGQ